MDFRRAGKSILFVSTPAAPCARCCDRALLARPTGALMIGDVDSVLEAYEDRATLEQPT